MIIRIWHGYTSPENAEAYENILKTEVMHEIEGKQIAGFREIRLLRKEAADEVKFITTILFDSMEAVKAFAGEDYEKAFVPEAARKVLKRFDERVEHYEVKLELKYPSTRIM